MKCLICNKSEKLNYLSDFILEIKEDEEFFKDAKIYRCSDCDFSFINPMPSSEKIDYFYKKIYRSNNRPPFLVGENYDEQKQYYLEDKNLGYVSYLTTLIDVKRIKNFYDFGCGNGDLGYALKKKFPKLNLFCTEGDSYCEKILNEREYNNLKNLNNVKYNFDLITTTHSLEHLTDINSIFIKFKEFLNPEGYIFFEVPNCTQEYFEGRAYDSPHLLFFTKKSIEKLAEIHNFTIINLSFSAYSFSDDHKYQRESQEQYYNEKDKIFSISKVKQTLKKIIPNKIINFRHDYLKIKNLNKDLRLNWFSNNTGDNCYIRGIFKKN